MKDMLKSAGTFAIGCVFIVSCIPPALIILAIYLTVGSDRD